jgi:hypothetical protein
MLEDKVVVEMKAYTPYVLFFPGFVSQFDRDLHPILHSFPVTDINANCVAHLALTD